LFVVEENNVRPLPISQNVTGFDDLYHGFKLGVYSVLRTFEHNKFLGLDFHVERTRRSMDILKWSYELDEIRLRQALHQVCTAYPLPDARVRFDVLARRPPNTNSRVLIGLMPFTPIPPHFYEEGVTVDFAPDLTRERPLAKTADFAQKRRAYPVGGEIYEYLLLDNQGYILEGTGSNFYGVRDGIFRTAGTGVLEGITRRIILNLAQELRLPVRLDAIHRDELPFLEEAAMSSSSRALLPVVKAAGQVIGDGRPGPIGQRILSAYHAYVARKIKTAV
jgi:branched-chain amino acid aminotransferase